MRAAHAAFWNYARCFILPFVNEEDRYLNSLPMFYTAGTGITYSMLLAGGSVALNKGFNPRTFWDDVRRFEATITIAIHGMVIFLLDQPPSRRRPQPPLRTVYMGPLARHKEFAERFGVSIYTALRDDGGAGADRRRGWIPRTSAAAAARRIRSTTSCRLVDEHDVPVPTGTPGELVVRHALPWTINSGYKNMPEATANAWRNGWFHTGDQFTQDEEGNFYFLDRMKDVIRRRGGEHLVVRGRGRGHQPSARQGRRGDRGEESGPGADGRRRGGEGLRRARAGRGAGSADLIEYLAGRMPRHWVPRYVEYMDELPRTESHKLKKSDLRDAGINPQTWDREKAGIKFKREVLT